MNTKPISATYRRTRLTRTNFEMLAWLFMRISGVVLIFLIFGHLFVNLWLGEGVKRIDFAFVAGKWTNPFWQFWDLAMLWLGMLHGTVGVRTVINDYARNMKLRKVLKVVLYLTVAATLVLGTMVIFTLSPCPSGADPSLLPSFCKN